MDKVDVAMTPELSQFLGLLVHGANANGRKIIVLRSLQKRHDAVGKGDMGLLQHYEISNTLAKA
jgi:hypothetical protein